MTNFLLTRLSQLRRRPSRKFQTLYATKFLALEAQLLLYHNQLEYIQTGFILRILLEVTVFSRGGTCALFKSHILSTLSSVFKFYKLVDSLILEQKASVFLRDQWKIPIIQNLAVGKFQDLRYIFNIMKNMIVAKNSNQELIIQFHTIISKPLTDVRLEHIKTILYDIANNQGPLTPYDLSRIQMISTFLYTMLDPFKNNGHKLLLKLIQFNAYWESEVASGAQADMDPYYQADWHLYYESQGDTKLSASKIYNWLRKTSKYFRLQKTKYYWLRNRKHFRLQKTKYHGIYYNIPIAI